MNLWLECEHLYAICRIPMVVVTKDGEPQLVLPAKNELVSQKAVRLVLTDFILQKRDALHPLVTYVEPGYFIGVVELPEDTFCIVGLVSPFQHSRSEIMQMASLAFAPQQMQAYCDLMVQMPLVNLYQLKSLLCLVVQLAHGTEISAENILFVDNTVLRTEKPDDALFNLREDAEFHVPVDFETGVCEAIEQGSTELLQHRLLQPSQGKVGAMSSNPLQQLKYSFVSFATLISRAAICGGLSGEVAFSLSDIYCQRADMQSEIPALQQLTYTMALDFCARVAEVRQQSIQSPPVRACTEYISQHLHDDLRMEDLARHCGLCTRSLSLKFKKELSMGIPEYIHREKLREAKYLLERTNYTLTQITTFLNYPTQSYFTQIFKKYEGCTPQQYRDDPRGLHRK